MILLKDAFVRAIFATVIYSIFSYPFILLGSNKLKAWVLDAIVVFIPVFLSMYAYNLIVSKKH